MEIAELIPSRGVIKNFDDMDNALRQYAFGRADFATVEVLEEIFDCLRETKNEVVVKMVDFIERFRALSFVQSDMREKIESIKSDLKDMCSQDEISQKEALLDKIENNISDGELYINREIDEVVVDLVNFIKKITIFE